MATLPLLGGVVGMVVFVLLFVLLVTLAVLWVMLPFAVFGIKNRLDTLIRLQTNTLSVLDPDGSKWASFNAYERARAEARKKK